MTFASKAGVHRLIHQIDIEMQDKTSADNHHSSEKNHSKSDCCANDISRLSTAPAAIVSLPSDCDASVRLMAVKNHSPTTNEALIMEDIDINGNDANIDSCYDQPNGREWQSSANSINDSVIDLKHHSDKNTSDQSGKGALDMSKQFDTNNNNNNTDDNSKTSKLVNYDTESSDSANIVKRSRRSSGSSSSSSTRAKAPIKASDIIGDFGVYQIAVVLFAALRAMCTSMDALSGPFLAPNVKQFQCELCERTSPAEVTINNFQSQQHGDFSIGNYRSHTKHNAAMEPARSTNCSIRMVNKLGLMDDYLMDSSQCFFTSATGPPDDRIPCNRWSFNQISTPYVGGPINMHSLTIEQSLVCDREWLKSLSNSMYFVGNTLGLLFWGIISDKFGRKTAYVCSHLVTLVFGFSTLFANSMCTFILLRSIGAFGMIGELIPRSILVEIVATRYRFVCSVMCQIGWATGIVLVPILSTYNPGYRFILAIPVTISALMLPWLYWLPESARWMMAHGHYTRARAELVRAATINGKLVPDIDDKIAQLNRQVLHEEVGDSPTQHQAKKVGIVRSMVAIFTSARLCRDTLSVFVLLFIAEVVYFSLTLNVADLGGSLYVNYMVSGLTEFVSIGVCGLMLAYVSRRACLSLLLLASTLSYLAMAVASAYTVDEDASQQLAMITPVVNAFAKLTAIGNLMVIILVSQEIFPTVIRQFGTSLCVTVGKIGSAVAPFTHELGQIIGQVYCFSMFSVLCLLCAIIPFALLSETGKRELPDTVIDVEQQASQSKSKSKNSTPHDSAKKQSKQQKLFINSDNSEKSTNINKSNGHVS